MICTSVYDTNENNRNRLREWITDYLMRVGMDMDVLWMTKNSSEEKIGEFALATNIAMVSLDAENGVQAGKMIYRRNPECRILYYSAEQQEIWSLLPTRPVCFYQWSEGKEAFQEKLGKILEEISLSNDIFHYETRKEILLTPYRNILYFQSDLKHVRIHNCDNSENEIFAKLSQVEPELNNRFIRIHKSYIVNSYHVDYINKKNHTVRLSNGEILPISDVQYDAAVIKFRNLKNTVANWKMKE